MKKQILLFTLLMALFGTVQSQIFPNPATLSTGQGTAGTLDPIWTVSSWYSSSPPNPIGLSYGAALINNNCAPGAWVDPASLPPPVNNGNWITASAYPCNGSVGYQYFRLTLNLPSDCNGNSVTTAGTYTLYFSGYADNAISDVFVNGNSTGISGGNFAPGGQLNITLPGPWVVGINYVDVLVYNGGGPYGLLLVANSTASSLADGDGDGVTDINDQCPCTPGTLANGCPAAITGDTIICRGESTTLTATGSGTYLWSTGSTNSAITVFPSVTTSYNVKITTSGGFIDSSAINVTVNPVPIVFITGDTLLCLGETTTLTGSGNGTYAWNTGSTNIAITTTPVSTTNYKVVVTNSFACKDSLSQSVTVFPKPIADFTFINQCNGTALPFNSSSTISNPGTIASCNWDFGDNVFAVGGNVSHTYSAPGNYDVILIVLSNNSCSDTIQKQDSVFNNPTVSFTQTNVCLGDSMHFTNTSSVDLPASISSYFWTFGGGGSSSNLKTPVYYYATYGPYDVTLVVTTADGCANAITTSVSVFDAPTTQFTSGNTCLFDSASFTNSSQDPNMGNIANWSWNFGDGSPLNTSTGSPSHHYVVPGNYQVTLITYSSNLSCPDTLKDSVTVFPMPVANLDFADVCLNQAMNFVDLSNVPSGTIASRSWNFGDGTAPDTNPNPNHIYTNYGTYLVSLIATTNNGCNDTISKNVIVHSLPTAQFSSINVCKGSITPFTDLSNTLPGDTIQAWSWNFGDSSPVYNNQNSSHLYTAIGSYSVQLAIISNFGCIDSISKTSIVNPNPTVNFTANDTIGCEPLCVEFQNGSSIITGANASLSWDFGDNSSTSSLNDPIHCYTNDSLFAPIRYSLILTVTSDSGCVSSLSKNNFITVFPNPNAGFTASPQTTSITNPVISISDLSTGANFWNWDFGDSATSSVNTPLPHTYADTGAFIITLICSTPYNCFDTTIQTVFIEPNFLFYIPNSFTPDGDGINDSFIGKGIFINEFEMAIFDRWGNLIYKTKDINIPWDGRANHGTEVAQNDIYIYSIKLTDFKRQKHVYKGKVTLIR